MEAPHRPLVLVALLSLLAAAPARAYLIIVDDQFNDGGRSNGADPLDVAWWEQNTGTTTTVNAAGGLTGNSLLVDSNGTFRPVVAAFPLTTIALGQRLRLAFDIQVFGSGTTGSGATLNGTGNPPNPSEFRFGLYNYNNTAPTADGNTSSGNDFGYRGRILAGSPAGLLDLLQEYGGSGDLLGGADGNGTLFGETASGTFNFADNTPRSVLFDILRGGTNLMEITMQVYSGVGLTGSILASVWATDTGNIRNAGGANTEPSTSQVYTSFNLIAFSSGHVDFNYRLDNIRVALIPEPTTLSLGILGALALLCRRRRRAQ